MQTLSVDPGEPGAAHALARGEKERERHLPDMQEGPPRAHSGGPHADARRGEAIHVPGVRQVLPQDESHGATRRHSHWEKAVRLRRLRAEVRAKAGAAGPQETTSWTAAASADSVD